MGITNSNKIIDQNRIDCDGSLRVTLALTAAPDIITNPTDIALVLDRSGSMTGSPLANMKTGAKTFIDIIAQSTGGTNGQIGSGSHIGIVSFSSTATADTQLITSVDTLKNAVDSLVAVGSTNHADAFTKAIQLFDPASSNQKVIVMFTDGNTTAGAPPAPVAAQARSQGIIIYCIGLIGSDGVDVNTLNEWATAPSAAHVAVTPDEAELEALFAELAANISKTGATDIVIDEIINSDFVNTSALSLNDGDAMVVNATTLKWTIPELGVTGSESAVLEFFIRHMAQTSGTKKVNESIDYSDAEGNQVIFPDPTVSVECDVVVHPEPCPIPTSVDAEGCQDLVEADLGDTYLESTGRIVEMDVTVKNVCPGKRVALAVILTEVDENGLEHQRGMKTMTLPAHSYPTCRDMLVKCIRFVLPDDLDVSGGEPQSMCGTRSLRARVIAHNIDTDYRCCESVLTV